LIKLLLDGVADVTIRDMIGHTAVYWAMGRDYKYALKALDGKKLIGFVLF